MAVNLEILRFVIRDKYAKIQDMRQVFALRTHEEIKEVLLDETAGGPDIHYYMIRGGKDKGNITVLESGLAGEEYIKTYGHYHAGKIDETYKILSGEGIVIMQTRHLGHSGKPIDDEIEIFKAVKVKTGDSVAIPAEAGHLLINTGKKWLVALDDSPVNFDEKNAASFPGHADYEPFKKLRGAAYYITLKNGKPYFVKNPRYKSAPLAEIS